MKQSYLVDHNGYYGEFGGAYVPEILYAAVEALKEQYLSIIESEEFKREYERIERQFHGNDEKFRWRARKRETSLEKLREEVGLDIPDDAPAIDEQAINADFIERFTSVLTEPQKEVFKKAYIENKPVRQISREMDMRLSTVQKHISLIQKKFLKKFLQKGGQK